MKWSYFAGQVNKTVFVGHSISPTTMIRFILVQVRGTEYCYA